MKLLTIDTTFNKLYVTLGGKDFFESRVIESDSEKFHSVYIASVVVELLKKFDMTVKNLDAIAVNIGPGSFTGIRVGMTVTRVLAQAHNISAIGISSLEILSKLNTSYKPTLVLIDARRGKAYAAIFGGEELAPCAVELSQAIEYAQSGKYFVIADKNMTKFLDENSCEVLNFEEFEDEFGKYLFEIAKEKFLQGGDFNWAKLKPLYIQPPPISMPKK